LTFGAVVRVLCAAVNGWRGAINGLDAMINLRRVEMHGRSYRIIVRDADATELHAGITAFAARITLFDADISTPVADADVLHYRINLVAADATCSRNGATAADAKRTRSSRRITNKERTGVAFERRFNEPEARGKERTARRF